MICDKCKKQAVMDVMSFSECEECEKPIISPCFPSHILCSDCADKLQRCEYCGCLLEN